MPPVTSGLLYNYLAGNIGQKDGSEGAFRALSRGYTVWASGRVDKIDVNSSNPLFCHVRCVVKASMKAARVSSSCTHVSAILHALVGLNPSSLTTTALPYSECDDAGPEDMPVTSKLCKWNVPKGRKNSSLNMMELTFTKHEYSKTIKRPIKRLDEFDPRPQEFRGTACQRLPELLKKLRGKQLGISLTGSFVSKYQRRNRP